jgi:hypothetical protein
MPGTSPGMTVIKPGNQVGPALRAVPEGQQSSDPAAQRKTPAVARRGLLAPTDRRDQKSRCTRNIADQNANRAVVAAGEYLHGSRAGTRWDSNS